MRVIGCSSWFHLRQCSVPASCWVTEPLGLGSHQPCAAQLLPCGHESRFVQNCSKKVEYQIFLGAPRVAQVCAQEDREEQR